MSTDVVRCVVGMGGSCLSRERVGKTSMENDCHVMVMVVLRKRRRRSKSTFDNFTCRYIIYVRLAIDVAGLLSLPRQFLSYTHNGVIERAIDSGPARALS